MITVPLQAYSDENGNEIHSRLNMESARITFRGKNNTVVIEDGAQFGRLILGFDGDNGTVRFESNEGVSPSSWNVRVGQDSSFLVARNVSTTNICIVSAVEGTSVTIGEDSMLASGNQLRADDAHAIYDVASGQRVNVSRSIVIGKHVWLGFESIVLSGAEIGEGSIVGLRSIVTKSIPNNVIAVGSPARIVRKNVAWERPHLSLSMPHYRPDSSAIRPTKRWWNMTAVPEESRSASKIMAARLYYSARRLILRRSDR